MLADVADASRPVRPENKGKYLTYEIGIYLARPYFLGAFGARMVTLTLDAGPYFAPCSLLVLMTTGAFVRQIFSTSAAIKSARRCD